MDQLGANVTVPQAFANQSAYCRANDAPITARVVEAIAALLDDPAPGAFARRIRDWPGRPLADALPLRAAGGLHALYQSGAAPSWRRSMRARRPTLRP